MAYQTLKDRFLQNESTIYSRNPLNAKEKNGWYLEIRPNDKSLVSGGSPALDTRSTPVVSAARDRKRITRFLLSGKGIAFLSKQALLQTGNTFGQTRLLNPLFVVKQLLPFTHDSRHIGGKSLDAFDLANIGGGTTKTGNPIGGQKINLLQKESNSQILSRVHNKMPGAGKTKISLNVISRITSPFAAVLSSIGSSTLEIKQRPEIQFNPGMFYFEALKSKSNIIRASAYHSDDRIRYLGSPDKSRQGELGIIGVGLRNRMPPGSITGNKDRSKFEFTGGPTRPEFISDSTLGSSKIEQDLILTATNIAFQKTITEFISGEKNIKSKGLTLGSSIQTLSTARVTRESRSNSFGVRTGRIAYVGVGSNPSANRAPALKDDINDYTVLNLDDSLKPDYVILTIEAGDSKIQLRSFIIDFAVNVQADYSEKRYIGRYEKFITYQGVNRKIDLSFFLIPQRKEELDNVWGKLDWLTRLTYPNKIQAAGYFEPPLAKFTLGRVFDRIPMFVTSISWKLENDNIWDIDREVPQYVKVTMSATILEAAMNTLQNGALYKIATAKERLLTAVDLNPPSGKVKTSIYVEPPLRAAPTTIPGATPRVPVIPFITP